MVLNQKPLMTIKRTREMLGADIQKLTDDEVQEMIDSAISFCEVVIDNFKNGKVHK